MLQLLKAFEAVPMGNVDLKHAAGGADPATDIILGLDSFGPSGCSSLNRW